MSGDLALFDMLDVAPAWEPVWEPEIEDYGWHFDQSISQVPLHADGSKISKQEWNEFTNTPRCCRDCGQKCAANAGGSREGHSFRVCEACAQLDHCELRCCDPVVEPGDAVFSNIRTCAHCACGWFVGEQHYNDEGDYVPYTDDEIADMCTEHMRPRHVSRWGKTHFPEQHGELIRKQEERRANYRKQVPA